jgi:hypothetical protein
LRPHDSLVYLLLRRFKIICCCHIFLDHDEHRVKERFCYLSNVKSRVNHHIDIAKETEALSAVRLPVIIISDCQSPQSTNHSYSYINEQYNTTSMTMNLFRMRLLSNLLALTIAVAVSSVSALILPSQLPAAVHRARSVQTTPFQIQNKNNHIGVITTSMILKSKTPTTPSSWIGQQQPQPRSRSRHSSALMLGPGNNNNNAPSGGGASDMDPGLKLLVCILIDFVGVASFAAPGLGEATDVGWAPISALIVNYLFGNGIFTALAFVEEISPGLDFIPTATLAWFFENANKEPVVNAPPPPPPPSPRPSQSPPRNNSNKPRESDVIDVDIVD